MEDKIINILSNNDALSVSELEEKLGFNSVEEF